MPRYLSLCHSGYLQIDPVCKRTVVPSQRMEAQVGRDSTLLDQHYHQHRQVLEMSLCDFVYASFLLCGSGVFCSQQTGPLILWQERWS